VDGKYPCQRNEIIALAALQAQVVYGTYDPEKHKPGFLKYVVSDTLLGSTRLTEILDYKTLFHPNGLRTKTSRRISSLNTRSSEA
jgi:hypothetical protein